MISKKSTSTALTALILTFTAFSAQAAEKLHHTANKPYTAYGKTYHPVKSSAGFSQTGQASWYGRAAHGRRTAGGERFDMNALTAAHRTLPIPSYAKVTNLKNGKSVIVRINDRGPFHHTRVIDVSHAAAKQLGFASAGVANVRVEAVTTGNKTHTGSSNGI